MKKCAPAGGVTGRYTRCEQAEGILGTVNALYTHCCRNLVYKARHIRNEAQSEVAEVKIQRWEKQLTGLDQVKQGKEVRKRSNGSHGIDFVGVHCTKRSLRQTLPGDLV